MTHSEVRSVHVYLYGANRGPMEISFEKAEQNLASFDRLFFEPDGSFIWRGDDDQQIDGMLYDAAGQVQYADIKANCAWSIWNQLIACFGQTTLTVLTLPGRELQDLQSFEESTWRESPID